ncbi:hypothetical protein CPB85DRAFT_1270130 [Mucidula mucida]|nr:hypothetical protein CPB85DRAFT_1270130 [Mucidula mucida]
MLKAERDGPLFVAAFQAPFTRSSYNRFYNLFTQNLQRNVAPKTRPEPSDDARDPLNVAFHSLYALYHSMELGLLSSLNAKDAKQLIRKFLEPISAWMAYCVHHIIVPGRASEFQHDFHIDAEICEPFSTLKSNHGSSGFFIPDVIPPLIRSHTTMSKAILARNVLSNLFNALRHLLMLKFNLQQITDPLWRKRLYDGLLEDVASFVAAYRFLATRELYRLRSAKTVPTMTRCLRILYDTCTVIDMFYNDYSLETVKPELLRQGHYRLMCNIIRGVASSTHLLHLVDGKKGKEADMLISLAGDCLWKAAYTLTDRIFMTYSLMETACKQDVITSLFKFEGTLAVSCASTKIRDQHAELVSGILSKASQYLIYYSILKHIAKTQHRIDKMGRPKTSEMWTAFLDRVGELEVDRKEYRKNPPTVCEWKGCTNRKLQPARLRSCSGCGFKYFYCSAECQKKHWDASHRRRCGEFHKQIEVQSDD